MKITFIGHASILIEASDVSILSDPWWRGPCFGAQWWNFPPAELAPLANRHIDYVYISHGHHDHFHPATLHTLGRDAKVLVSRRTGLRPAIESLGFAVIEVDDDHLLPLGGGVRCRVIETYAQDTLMVVDDGHEVCLNLNDALHSAPRAVQTDVIARLKELYPKIDYVFCGYGVASHFPNCYEIPGKDREATAARRQRHFNREWAHIVAELEPRFAFPFAADVALLQEDLLWANEPTHNAERPTDVLREKHPQSSVATFDIAPGFTIEAGEVLTKALRQPVHTQDLRSRCPKEIERANRAGSVQDGEIDEILGLLRGNLEICGAFLKSNPLDYRCLIRFRNSRAGICVTKRGPVVGVDRVDSESDDGSYDLTFTTRVPYLKHSLTLPFGNEILFVGSGGIFAYSDPAKARLNLHHDLMQLLKRQDAPLSPRPASATLVGRTKAFVKRLLGRAPGEDLYDLAAWTVFNEGGSAPRRD